MSSNGRYAGCRITSAVLLAFTATAAQFLENELSMLRKNVKLDALSTHASCGSSAIFIYLIVYINRPRPQCMTQNYSTENGIRCSFTLSKTLLILARISPLLCTLTSQTNLKSSANATARSRISEPIRIGYNNDQNKTLDHAKSNLRDSKTAQANLNLLRYVRKEAGGERWPQEHTYDAPYQMPFEVQNDDVVSGTLADDIGNVCIERQQLFSKAMLNNVLKIFMMEVCLELFSHALLQDFSEIGIC